VALLDGLGLRVTPQRLLILEALQSSTGHVTAEEIHSLIVEAYPNLNIATVYRNLDVLVAAGLLTETRLAGKYLYYELSPGSRHHHLVCERCGHVAELDDVLVEPLRQAIARQYGFTARVEHLAVFGVCRGCEVDEGSQPPSADAGPAEGSGSQEASRCTSQTAT
jgi:Fur family transcriptional regulator, ferric uptake regulator